MNFMGFIAANGMVRESFAKIIQFIRHRGDRLQAKLYRAFDRFTTLYGSARGRREVAS